MCHGLPEELKITATMVALKLAPAVRKFNSDKTERFDKKGKGQVSHGRGQGQNDRSHD